MDAIPTVLPGLPIAPITLVPRTTIPITRSACPHAATPPPSTGAVAFTSPSATPHTGQPPPHPQTCQALEGVARGSSSRCHTVESCSALDCNFLEYHARITIKPCDNPPDVGVVIRDFLGNVVFREVLVNSRTQPVQVGGRTLFDLIINITHTANPDAIVLQVCACVCACMEVWPEAMWVGDDCYVTVE